MERVTQFNEVIEADEAPIGHPEQLAELGQLVDRVRGDEQAWPRVGRARTLQAASHELFRSRAILRSSASAAREVRHRSLAVQQPRAAPDRG